MLVPDHSAPACPEYLSLTDLPPDAVMIAAQIISGAENPPERTLAQAQAALGAALLYMGIPLPPLKDVNDLTGGKVRRSPHLTPTELKAFAKERRKRAGVLASAASHLDREASQLHRLANIRKRASEGKDAPPEQGGE